jgi:hypothetical protein
LRVLGAIVKFLDNLNPVFAKPYTRSSGSLPKMKLNYSSLILLSVGSEVKKVISKEHVANMKVGKGNNFIEEHKAVTVFAMKAHG